MVRRLLLLNGFSILGVILYHSVGWGFVAMFSWAHRYMPVLSPNFDQIGGIPYYAMRFVEQLVVFTIPAFLFVSGFFVAFATGRMQSNIKWETIGARIKRMLIPYLIWSFVLFGLFFIQGNLYTLQQYLRMLFTGQTNPAYYYVPLLIQFYLLSPLIVPLAKRNWKIPTYCHRDNSDRCPAILLSSYSWLGWVTLQSIPTIDTKMVFPCSDFLVFLRCGCWISYKVIERFSRSNQMVFTHYCYHFIANWAYSSGNFISNILVKRGLTLEKL